MANKVDGSRAPVHVTVTGAAGQIGYSLVFRIASGQLLGPDQPIVLRLLEIEPAMKALQGVAMELDDCAFPLLTDIVLTSNTEEAFDGTSWALLVGSEMCIRDSIQVDRNLRRRVTVLTDTRRRVP